VKSKTSRKSASIHEIAGETVLKEYMLLNIFPRDIADAHLSGSLHIRGLSSWISKPSEVIHDLRFFFQNGLPLEKINALMPSYSQPQNLESALAMAFNVLLHSTKEIDETQTVDYFNVFLAPFAKGIEHPKIKESLRLFIANISQHIDASLSIELTIPDFVANKPAFGPSGKTVGKYGDYYEESQTLAILFLEILAEESEPKPFFDPKIIIKIRPETFADEKAKAILLKTHHLASEKGVPYFANLLEKGQKHVVFSASGFRLETDLNKDWEIDTLRTGCLGYVTINLPRIAYESGKDEKKFFEIFKERLEMATRALEIKDRSLKQHGKGLLPFLMQSANGDHYFRIENCSSTINLAGLKEASEAFYEKSTLESKSLELVGEIMQNFSVFAQRSVKKRGRRLSLGMLPDFEASENLVRMDIEKYGIAKVRFSGTREKPVYSTINRIILENDKTIPQSLGFEQKTRELNGGSLAVVELGEIEAKADELMSMTKQLFEKHTAEFLTYNRKLTYCVNCKKSWTGLLHKCPSCGSVGTLTFFDRYSLT
jgi:ribonucleoside-triphosphate reductase